MTAAQLKAQANALCPLARYCRLPGTTERGCTLACQSGSTFDIDKWKAGRS